MENKGEIMNEYEEAILVIYAITVLMMGGVAIIHAIGLGIMRVLDRRTGRKKWWIVGRAV
jgi:hypothetical protein